MSRITGTYGDVDLERSFLLQALRKLLRLLDADVLDLTACALELLVAKILCSLASLLLLLPTHDLRTAASLLFLLPNGELREKFAPASHKSTSNLKSLALRLRSSDECGELRLLLFLGGWSWGVQSSEGIVESGCDGAEASANELRGGELNGADIGHGGRRAGIFDSSKGAVDECDTARCVIHTYVKLTTASTAHDIRLDLLVIVRPRTLDGDIAQGGGELQKVADLHRVVHLGELGEKTGEEGALEERNVGSIRGVGCEGLQ